MDKQLAPGLKIAFVVHGSVGLLYGAAQLLLPEAFGKLFGLAVPDPIFWRLLGAAILGFAATSWLAVRATTWDEVKITVIAEIVWPALATLIMLWAVLSAAWPVTGWLNVIVLGGFAVTFGYFYVEEVRVILPRLGAVHH